MHIVAPKVILLGETTALQAGIDEFLDLIGAPEWCTDAPSDLEGLIELYGRACYKSFKPGLNPNVQKIRESNADYLSNILKTHHGSVTEHAVLNFIIFGTRVFTHELVRQRAGTAFSQESLRYVRLADLPFWHPDWALEDQELMERNIALLRHMEEHQAWMSQHFGLDEPGVDFGVKKHRTSYMRRYAPIGLSTVIGFSANIRAIRWILELRTDPAAEEEMRIIAAQIGDIVIPRYQNLFSDFDVVEKGGARSFVPKNSKI